MSLTYIADTLNNLNSIADKSFHTHKRRQGKYRPDVSARLSYSNEFMYKVTALKIYIITQLQRGEFHMQR